MVYSCTEKEGLIFWYEMVSYHILYWVTMRRCYFYNHDVLNIMAFLILKTHQTYTCINLWSNILLLKSRLDETLYIKRYKIWVWIDILFDNLFINAYTALNLILSSLQNGADTLFLIIPFISIHFTYINVQYLKIKSIILAIFIGCWCAEV